jgi:hypothetical protein
MNRRIRLAAITAALVALVTVPTISALADSGGAKVLDASLAGLPASQVNTTLFGIKAGGLPWQIDHGSAQLFSDGRLHVEVQGLVLAAGPAAGTNPIASGQAILTCAGSPAAMSSVVPFSSDGTAEVNERISLPPGCLAPALFFAGVPAPGVQRWFAVTGW